MLDVAVGAPQRHRCLTVFPLLAPAAPELPYLLMADALAAGTLRITEVGAGTVPELLATNLGDQLVLVLDGEQLVGARQNRTTNRSLLLPAESETRIPVSCMEQGRWHFQGDHFAPTKHSSPTTVRRHAREVEASYARAGAAAPASALSQAQGAVWHSIAEQADALDARSETGALDRVYAERAEDLESWLLDFPGVPDQVGLLAFLGARPLGMDVVGSRALYARLHDRLLLGYVMDALGSRGRGRTLAPEIAQPYLDQVAAALRVDSPTVGWGRYAVLSGAVIGGELRDGERLAHFSAFPERPVPGGGTGGPVNPISPPSRRRRPPA